MSVMVQRGIVARNLGLVALCAATVSVLCFVGANVIAANAAQLLENPSFEGTKNGRAVGWQMDACFRAERGVGHNGSGGAVWESSEPSKAQSGCVAEINAEKGVAYRFSCLVRTENFVPGPRGRACICIEWFDDLGRWMGGDYSPKFADRNADWIEIGGATRNIPQEAKKVTLQLYVMKGSKGRVSFDNVVVRPLKRNPVAFVFSSAYRDMAVSGPVRFHAALFPGMNAKADDIVAEFSYAGADGAMKRVAPTEFSVDGASLALRVEDMAMGCHPVTCTLSMKDGGKLGEASCVFTRVGQLPQRRVWIDEHQRCIVGGKPFFPLGMYWKDVAAEKLAKYAEGPFNCLMPYTRATCAQLDLCRDKGFMVFQDLRGTLHSAWGRRKKFTSQGEVDAFYEAEINKVKDHPALLAWYVNDESPVTEVPERTHLYLIFRRLDPDHPTWAVLDRVHDLREFIPTFDVLGVDPYPVSQKPLSHIAKFMRGTQKAIFRDRPLWNVPQTFNWGWYRKNLADRERFPTEQEMKNMNWQHVALGANGLVAYCYHGLYKYIKPDEFDNYWKPICNSFAEVKKMVPVILSAEKAPKASSGTPEMVPVRTWMFDGCLYVLAVNVLAESQSVELGISEGNWEVASCEVGIAGRMVAPNRLALELPSLGVSFMRLKGKEVME